MTRLVASNEDPEVLAHLVVAAVFKTVGTRVNRRSGGFDSHALPLSSAIGSTRERIVSETQAWFRNGLFR